MMNFVVDPGILALFVPAGTELDFYEGGASFNADVAKLYGEEFVAPLSVTAASRSIAEGSHVQVWRKVDDPALIAAMTTDPR